jgi:hypothetical protein
MWAFHFRLAPLLWWLAGIVLAVLALTAPKFEVSVSAAVLALSEMLDEGAGSEDQST